MVQQHQDEPSTKPPPAEAARPQLPQKPFAPGTANFQKDLAAYYPFNGNANDESGNEHQGAVHGTALSLDRHGNSEQAVQFDGQNDYISIAYHEDLNFAYSDSLTFSLWIKPSRLQSQNGILSKYHRSRGYILRLRHEKGLLQWGGEGVGPAGSDVYGLGSLQLEKWYQIVVVNSNKRSDLYVNAVLVARGPTKWPKKQNVLTFGCDYLPDIDSPERFFKGSLDDIHIYNRAFTATEVKQLYDF